MFNFSVSKYSYQASFLILILINITTTNSKPYYSQSSQDQYLNENIFKNKLNGFFVEIGAFDGVQLSNSYFFEKELKWKGICIEPIPEIYKLLRANRTCICVEGIVYNHTGFEDFKHFQGGSNPASAGEMWSGIPTKLHPNHLAIIEHYNKVDGGRSEQILKVKSYLLNDLLKEYGVSYVDYLSVDTEGSELEILKTIDFEKYYIHVIGVENNYQDSAISEFLKSKGFKFIQRLGFDDIFVNIKIN